MTLTPNTVELIALVEQRVKLAEDIERLQPLVTKYNTMVAERRTVEDQLMRMVDKLDLTGNYEGTRMRGGVMGAFLADMFALLKARALSVAREEKEAGPDFIDLGPGA